MRIVVPSAVRRGEDVRFVCQYELEPDETLYSMKWYKGKREFFRYTPKENPPIRQFPVSGISVEVRVRRLSFKNLHRNFIRFHIFDCSGVCKSTVNFNLVQISNRVASSDLMLRGNEREDLVELGNGVTCALYIVISCENPRELSKDFADKFSSKLRELHYGNFPCEIFSHFKAKCRVYMQKCYIRENVISYCKSHLMTSFIAFLACCYVNNNKFNDT